ncbi:MAG TPA: methyl-accepting chemotaxis protein [Geobacteraceae bacterium]|nr:methyl-accepting chemotaxis protein [Geobacteraceae bacterium]
MDHGSFIKRTGRRFLYAEVGFVMGISAPLIWIIIRLILFQNPEQSLWAQIVSDITRDGEHLALYCYMGFGTAVTMSSLGYFIGKATDELYRRGGEMDALHREVAEQKEVFENRYKMLDTNVKHIHQISSRIQKSLQCMEILSLCSEGLHNILGYERVNILMADETRSHLFFYSSTGFSSEDDMTSLQGVKLPLDERGGVIFKCFNEKKLYLIDDIKKYPAEFQVRPPYDSVKQIRSKSFMLCPLVVKGESVGLFGIDNKYSQRALNETDIDTLKLFADQVALAMTRINLLSAIDNLTGELEKASAELLQKKESYHRNVFNLKAAVDSVFENTASIASASEGVMASVHETSTASGEITVAIDQVSKNLDSLAEAVDKSVSAMDQISVSLKNVEQNATLSHETSRQVKAEADKSGIVVEETIAALDEIQNSVELSYQGIKRLSENSYRIEGIVRVINDITKRTNLLALNASIIAAQAGEYGNSFGVVADEIRNLSLQTGQSTAEINGIIEEIMNEARLAAKSVTATKDLVQKGVKLGGDTGKALRVILESSQRAMEMTEKIKLITTEQTESAGLVARSMEDISTMTSQIFMASKEQANATKNIEAAINSIKAMANEMVTATNRQVEDGKDIKDSVELFGQMITAIFDDVERRREESVAVLGEAESMRQVSG